MLLPPPSPAVGMLKLLWKGKQSAVSTLVPPSSWIKASISGFLSSLFPSARKKRPTFSAWKNILLNPAAHRSSHFMCTAGRDEKDATSNLGPTYHGDSTIVPWASDWDASWLSKGIAFKKQKSSGETQKHLAGKGLYKCLQYGNFNFHVVETCWNNNQRGRMFEGFLPNVTCMDMASASLRETHLRTDLQILQLWRI